MQILKINDEQYVNDRLDKSLSLLIPELSRSKIQEMIDKGYIVVNGKREKASYRLELNDEISVAEMEVEEQHFEAEDIPLEIVYEDDYLLIVNKPKGLVTHPGAGNFNHTLVNALKFHSKNLSSVNGEYRLGIVHRLDKDTGGLLVVAKDDNTHLFLQDQLKDHSLGRTYIALVKGVISEDEGTIIAPIGRDKDNRLKMAVDLKNGKDAITHFKVIKRFKDTTLVECKLETGRTHQIRVHMNYINHPIIGDPLYGKDNRRLYNDGQLLFAYKISFNHPKDKKRREFEVSLPNYFKDVIISLR